MLKNYWQELWQERGEKFPGDDPVKLDGFDVFGKLSSAQLSYVIQKIRQSLQLKKKDTILEVGCGAGMTLGPVSQYAKLAYGVDIADSMVAKAIKFYPNLRVITAEAADLPFKEEMFDGVFSFSVFQYFPNLGYAEKAMGEMIRVLKKPGIIFISDIPDRAKEKEYILYRDEQKIPDNLWRSSVKVKLNHLYYKQQLFMDFFSRKGFSCKISNQDIPDWGLSAFKFNVFVYRK